MKTIILASTSPRRRKVLEILGLKFKVVPSNVDEKLNPRYQPRRQAEMLSEEKALAVVPKHKNSIVIAADTLVALGNDVIGKPKDIADAKRTIKKLSGKTHSVFTGFTVIDTETKKQFTESVETKVTFKKLSEKEISGYLKKAKVLDKAGGYGVQELGAVLVERIDGDFYNPVGLPISALAQVLKKFDINII